MRFQRPSAEHQLVSDFETRLLLVRKLELRCCFPFSTTLSTSLSLLWLVAVNVYIGKSAGSCYLTQGFNCRQQFIIHRERSIHLPASRHELQW